MLRFFGLSSALVTLCAWSSLLCTSSLAGTIIKLSLSAAPADIIFNGTVLGTIDDGDGTTSGDQNTSAVFLDLLDSQHADILPPDASFSLKNLSANGPVNPFPTISPVLVIQDFTGGNFELYDTVANGDTLLLSGTLNNSTLTGPIGPPATGALFTTSFANVTGGTLMPFIDAGSLTLSMTFTQISNGAGFSIDMTNPAAPKLNTFTADAAVNIAAEPSGPIVPEPVAATLLLIGAALAGAAARIRR